MKSKTKYSVHDCKLISLPSVVDHRGSLGFIEGGVQIPFSIERIYYLSDISDKGKRGQHAHRELEQLIMAISGSFEIHLHDGVEERRFHMNARNEGLHVLPGMWRDLSNFSTDAVCLVLASQKFSEADYIRDFGEFLKWRNERG